MFTLSYCCVCIIILLEIKAKCPGVCFSLCECLYFGVRALMRRKVIQHPLHPWGFLLQACVFQERML